MKNRIVLVLILLVGMLSFDAVLENQETIHDWAYDKYILQLQSECCFNFYDTLVVEKCERISGAYRGIKINDYCRLCVGPETKDLKALVNMGKDILNVGDTIIYSPLYRVYNTTHLLFNKPIYRLQRDSAEIFSNYYEERVYTRMR